MPVDPHRLAEARSLTGDVESVARAIAEDSERGRTLRQSTPFAGVLDPRERWQLWDQVREELERRGDGRSMSPR